MQIRFFIIGRKDGHVGSHTNAVYLRIDNWNDFSFVTMFDVYVYDENGEGHSLSSIKVGFVGQTTDVTTHSTLEKEFDELPAGYFSVATDVDFYRKLCINFSQEWRDSFLEKIRDVVKTPAILEIAKDEDVFQISHLRGVSINAIRDKFSRVLEGDAPPTDFHFHFSLPASEKFAGYDLEFNVNAGSLPSTNIHAIIGRNGVGKTTLLKSMVKAISGQLEDGTEFLEKKNLFEIEKNWQRFFCQFSFCGV